ncbi:MAG: hypothetical protein M3042_09355, partial [Actinomycetota bacterium]|nr:hypothetical protein [Actinomycetota bacterium]
RGRTLVPDTWAYTKPGASWSTSSWASDVVLALAHRAGGDRAIVLLELLGTLAVLGGLYLLLRRHRASSRAIVFCLACVSLWPFFEERPQLASMIFVVWLSWVCDRARRHDGEPSLTLLLAATWLWACIHGMWVLVPVALLLVVTCRRLDGDRLSAAGQRRLLAAAALAPLVSMLTPVGPRLLLAPFRVSSAASGRLAEWFAPRLDRPFAWGFVALLVLTLLCWAMGDRRPARSEVLWVLAVAAYAGLAWRNLGPACLLIAPVTARALDGRRRGADRFRVPTVAAAALTGVAVLALLLATLTSPTSPAWAPTKIAARLRAQPGQVRVLNDYDLGGYLATAGAPSVRVAVDGRADRYGGRFLDRYFALTDGRPGWQSALAGLRPDVAVLSTDTPLVALLTDRGWHQVTQDKHFVLLVAPGFHLVER